MRLIIIASGSKSNAALVEHDGAAVLIDCGVTFKTLITSMSQHGLTLSDLKAVFVTHNHSDHVKGLSTLRKKTDIPFLSPSGVDLCENMIEPFADFGFDVSSFTCSHDVDCVGYKITCGQKTLCIATDTGIITDEIKSALEGCETIVIESNHDLEMLKYGPYPLPLKQRIASDKGHLSNTDCAKLLAYLANLGLRRAVLAHLSENNNTPLLAKSTSRDELLKYGFEIELMTAIPHLEIEL